MIPTAPVLETSFPGLTLHRRGKVRDVYEVLLDTGETALLMVATDRISAFDYVLGSGIPDKGKVLTQLSGFWFERMGDLALHIAAANPLAVTEEDVPAEDREREERIAVEQAADRPENVRERIVQGKLDKWLDDVVLLRQKHVNEDKYGGKTIEDLRAELASETRENVVIRRFARFAIGG